MFYYKTLELLQLKPNSIIELSLLPLVPFAASCFLTGGVQGSELLEIPSWSSMVIGATLYIFRINLCVDASNKFPARFSEIKASLRKAMTDRDYKEIARLIITVLSSTGYALTASVSVYTAALIMLGWCQVDGSSAAIISYLFTVLGTMGLFPLTLYWTHRGLKQLTFGGTVDQDGNSMDPTDRYTYLGLLCVIPNILGVIGAASSTTNPLFPYGNNAIEIIRITTSIIYAAASGTPGLSMLLRAANRLYCNNITEIQNDLVLENNMNFEKNFVLARSNGQEGEDYKEKVNSSCCFFSQKQHSSSRIGIKEESQWRCNML